MTVGPDGRCRVLLVEDESLIAMLMEDMLSEFDCEVLASVGQLDEAIAIARTQRFDMAFIDVNLRGVPAWPLADILRAQGVPFAFVTGYGAAGTIGPYADVAVLQKPFRSEDLLVIIQRLRMQRPRSGH